MVLLMALGWWAMTTLGSDSPTSNEIPHIRGRVPAGRYHRVALGGRAVQRRAHLTRSPHAGREVAHSSMLMEAKGTGRGKAPPGTSQNSPSPHLDE